MSDIEKSANGKIRVYACGGAGTNLGSMLEKHRSQMEIGFGILDVVYVDTSKSNVKSHVTKSNSYLIEGLDGSGKVRAENSDEIIIRIKAILQQFKPADLNIVISSAAGGSGSVFGPLLAQEMLAADAPVVVLCIGSADTVLDANNTLKTLKSYASIAKRLNTPVVMAYAQNSAHTSRAEVDNIMFNMVMSLLLLFSRQHHELDSRDLHHWLKYTKVTSYPAELVSLIMLDSGNETGDSISVATLTTEGGSTALVEIPEYQCVGFLPTDVDDAVLNRAPLHYAIVNGVLPDVSKSLQKMLADVEQKQQARIGRTAILNGNEAIHESGLIF